MNQASDQTNFVTTAPAETTETLSILRPWRYKQELVLAFVLVLASHIFVLTFGKIARWELDLTHASKLTVPQLERCQAGNQGTLDESCQMDCCWYSTIIRSGYDREPAFDGGDRANWNFFPVFPLSAIP